MAIMLGLNWKSHSPVAISHSLQKDDGQWLVDYELLGLGIEMDHGQWLMDNGFEVGSERNSIMEVSYEKRL